MAHNVHPVRVASWSGWPRRRASVAHCPASNAALGSGIFPLRPHVEAGVRCALGTDVGAGTGFSLLKEGLQALPDAAADAGRHAAQRSAIAVPGDARGAEALALGGRDRRFRRRARPADFVYLRPRKRIRRWRRA